MRHIFATLTENVIAATLTAPLPNVNGLIVFSPRTKKIECTQVTGAKRFSPHKSRSHLQKNLQSATARRIFSEFLWICADEFVVCVACRPICVSAASVGSLPDLIR